MFQIYKWCIWCLYVEIKSTSGTADRNSERLRAKEERRRVAGAEGLAAEASRKSTRRKSHPLRVDEKVKKARAEAERRSAVGTDFLAAEAIWKSAHRKTNPLTVEQKAKCNLLSTI